MYNEKTTYRQMPENELLYYNMTNDYMFRAVLQKNQRYSEDWSAHCCILTRKHSRLK